MDLIFAQSTRILSPILFNSPKYQFGETVVLGSGGLRTARDPFHIQPEPHCCQLRLGQKTTANTDKEEVIQYFKAAGGICSTLKRPHALVLVKYRKPVRFNSAPACDSAGRGPHPSFDCAGEDFFTTKPWA